MELFIEQLCATESVRPYVSIRMQKTQLNIPYLGPHLEPLTNVCFDFCLLNYYQCVMCTSGQSDYLDLYLSQVEGFGKVCSLGGSQVWMFLECLLHVHQLLSGEGRPPLPGLYHA